jgi:hypothetical protein
MKQTFKFLSSTGRRLRSALTKIAHQFTRRGSATLKIKIKIPLFFEAEIGVETDWDRDRAR